MGIKHTSHARYEIWYHIAWSTKYRKKVFKAKGLRKEIGDLFREIALQYDMEIDKISVMSDHLHLTLSVPPRIASSHAIQIIKSVSTKMMFKRYKFLKGYYWGGEIWIAGYFIRSVGPGLTKEAINRYILEQSEEI